MMCLWSGDRVANLTFVAIVSKRIGSAPGSKRMASKLVQFIAATALLDR